MYVKTILGNLYHLDCLKRTFGFHIRPDYYGRAKACIDSLMEKLPNGFVCCVCGKGK